MKITQINGARGLIIKSSIKNAIIDSDVENASAFDDVIVTHLSLDTLNIIQNNSNKFRRINLSHDLMLLLQKLWRYNIISRPNVMPNFRILPTGYKTKLGLEFNITAYDNDDGLIGSIAIIIEDTASGEKLGYVPNFITQGQYKNRIKKWKRMFRDTHLTQFTSFNSNINPDTTATQVNYSEKSFSENLPSLFSDLTLLQSWLKPFNPTRLNEINDYSLKQDQPIIWQCKSAKLLNYYFPDNDFYYIDDGSEINEKQKNHLICYTKDEIKKDMLVEKKDPTPLINQIDIYARKFKHSLPQSDFSDIVKMIKAQETYMI